MAVGIVAVVVISLIATGVIPLFPAPAGSHPPSFEGAASAARSSVTSVRGGPWTLEGGVGVASSGPSTANTSFVNSNNCTFQPVPSPLPSVVRPAAYGMFSDGDAPWWSLIFVNSSEQGLLFVDVLNGTAYPVATGTGACVGTLVALGSLPTTVVDSTTVASTFWSDGASSFVGYHSTTALSLVMGVVAGGGIPGSPYSFTGATWILALSSCTGGSAASSTEPVFLQLFNATTGAPESEAISTTLSCASLSSLASLGSPAALAATGPLGPASECSRTPFPVLEEPQARLAPSE